MAFIIWGMVSRVICIRLFLRDQGKADGPIMSWILLLALLAEQYCLIFQSAETSPDYHDPSKIIKSGLAMPWASLTSISGCMLSRPFDLWISRLFKQSLILSTTCKASLIEKDFLPRLSCWSHIPGVSFASKDWCEEDLQYILAPSMSFQVTRSPAPPISRPIFSPSLLFMDDVSIETNLLPFMSLTRLSSKWVLELLTIIPKCQSGSILRWQFCVYITIFSLLYVTKQINFPRETGGFSLKLFISSHCWERTT